MRPYGYESDRFTVRESEATNLRSAAERLLDGVSLRAVTNDLNESGARTTAGNLWQPNVLRRNLMSPRVAGKKRVGDGSFVDGGWQPILDEKTYQRLVELLSDEERTTGGSSGRRAYLLTGGLATCGLCGKSLIARPNNNGRRGYVCSKGAPSHGCGKIRINADNLEKDVAERVLAQLLRDDARPRLEAAIEAAQQRAAEAPNVIRRATAREKTAAEEYAAGTINAAQLRTITLRLQEQIRDARRAKQLGAGLAKVSIADATGLVAWWEAATLEQQQALVHTLVTSVEVLPVIVRGSKIYDSQRVRVKWRTSDAADQR